MYLTKPSRTVVINFYLVTLPPLVRLKASLHNCGELSGIPFKTFICLLQCLPPCMGTRQWEWGSGQAGTAWSCSYLFSSYLQPETALTCLYPHIFVALFKGSCDTPRCTSTLVENHHPTTMFSQQNMNTECFIYCSVCYIHSAQVWCRM